MTHRVVEIMELPAITDQSALRHLIHNSADPAATADINPKSFGQCGKLTGPQRRVGPGL